MKVMTVTWSLAAQAVVGVKGDKRALDTIKTKMKKRERRMPP